MPRLLRLRPSTYKRLVRLSEEAERDSAYRVAKRLRAVFLNSKGLTSGELALILDAPRSKVSEWLLRYQRYGVEGLLEGYRSGRPGALTEQQRQRLRKIVDRGPMAYGLDSGGWTSAMLARVIEQQFRVTYHPGHVRKLLRTLGLSVGRRLPGCAKAGKKDRWYRRRDLTRTGKPNPETGT